MKRNDRDSRNEHPVDRIVSGRRRFLATCCASAVCAGSACTGMAHIGMLHGIPLFGTPLYADEPDFVFAERDDWVRLTGPDQNSQSRERGLLHRWPEGGPRLVRQIDGLGGGWAAPCIAGNRIFCTARDVDAQSSTEEQSDFGVREYIIAFDRDTGAKLWRTPIGPAYEDSYPGVRATATWFDGRLYHLSGVGNIHCLDATTGEVLWRRNIVSDFGARRPTWGFAEALFVDSERVYVSVGSERSMMVALDCRTGKTRWESEGFGGRPGYDDTGVKPGYSAPLFVEYGGFRQLVTMTSDGAIGVDMNTGRILWDYPQKGLYEVNASMPLWNPDDGCLMIFGTWNLGATKLKLHVSSGGDSPECRVEKLWHTTKLDNEHGGVMRIGDFLYGHADGNHRRRYWTCISYITGETQWTSDWHPGKSGTLTAADGLLYVVSDTGRIALVPADPAKFEPVSEFELPDAAERSHSEACWAHPIICGGRLYLRHAGTIFIYDILGEKS